MKDAMQDEILMALVTDLAEIPAVDSILLGGSRARGTADPSSDYDLYVYTEETIPTTLRKPIMDRHLAPGYELDNRFWETEDDGALKANGIAIDIVYRSLSWLSSHLHSLLEEHQAGTGYSTCMWRNLKESAILFDRNGKARALQDKSAVDYPVGLVRAIVAKNRPLLNGSIPAYRDQVAKAASRGDAVSVNHRTSAWFESYFDVLFAVNHVPHPGEKKIVDFLKAEASMLPENWDADVAELCRLIGTDGGAISGQMDKMCTALDELLSGLGD